MNLRVFLHWQLPGITRASVAKLPPTFLRDLCTLIGGKREWALYFVEVYGSHMCTYVCVYVCVHLLCVHPGAYSPCDSYICTCALVTANLRKHLAMYTDSCKSRASWICLQLLVRVRSLKCTAWIADCPQPEPVEGFYLHISLCMMNLPNFKGITPSLYAIHYQKQEAI